MANSLGCSEYGLKGELDYPAGAVLDSAVAADTADSAEPPIESCDGKDNDGDGEVDEGFSDTDGDGTADCVDAEDCDGLDNDGDGEVDEGFPDADGDSTADCLDLEECDGLDNDGDGEVDEGFDKDEDGIADCKETLHTVALRLTTDDIWEGYNNGSLIDKQSGWNQVDSYSLSLSTGTHVLAIHGWDVGLSIAGFLAEVSVDGTPVSRTGDGSWRVMSGSEPTGWTEVTHDDSSWAVPVTCADTSPWGSEPSALLDTGSVWVWYEPNGDCRSSAALDDAWFRLTLQLD